MGICLAAAQDGDLSAGGITVRILGQSGKFRMFSTAAGENNTNVVTIEMDFFFCEYSMQTTMLLVPADRNDIPSKLLQTKISLSVPLRRTL